MTLKTMPTYKSYIIGFILSLALTLAAYFAVINQVPVTLWVITGLALIQFLVQLIFFLHLGQGPDGHWNLVALISTFGAVVVLILGTLWIMSNLSYNMTPQKINDYIIKDEGMMK